MGKKRKKIILPELPAGITVIDTHCHLDMICGDEEIDALVRRTSAAGVSPIITIGIDVTSSTKAVELANRHDPVYATVGIHPHNVQGVDHSTYRTLAKLCADPKVVAYGEIGLDYVKQYAPQDMQLEHYKRQVDLAQKMALPLVIHDREAHDDILQVLVSRKPFPAGGVMHCFSGDWSYAQKVLDLGFLVSIPGVVTFNKAAIMQEVARKIPLDKLILETDAPFLAPDPLRGKQNIPEYVLFTAQKIAELRGLSLEEVARTTTENALKLFKIPSR